MKRAILAVIGAIVIWAVAATLIDWLLRWSIAGYAAAEPSLHFTPGMMLARLTLAALASLSAGAGAAWIAPASRRAAWIAGLILLIGFLPAHLRLWNQFPLWYHLTFFVSLIVLLPAGARLAGLRGAPPPQPQAVP